MSSILVIWRNLVKHKNNVSLIPSKCVKSRQKKTKQKLNYRMLFSFSIVIFILSWRSLNLRGLLLGRQENYCLFLTFCHLKLLMQVQTPCHGPNTSDSVQKRHRVKKTGQLQFIRCACFLVELWKLELITVCHSHT